MRLRTRARSGQGAASTDYLVVAGVTVVVLLGLWSVFRDELTAAIRTLTCNVVAASTGGGGCGGGTGDSAARGEEPAAQAALEPWELNQTAEARRRRQALFDQVGAELARTNGDFAIVAGGGGRLWRVRSDGTAVLLQGTRTAAEQDLQRGQVLYVGRGGTGSAPVVKGTVDAGPPPPSTWDLKIAGSSEHASVRGTINGGGDFI
jgi:hypothetical protein